MMQLKAKLNCTVFFATVELLLQRGMCKNNSAKQIDQSTLGVYFLSTTFLGQLKMYLNTFDIMFFLSS